MTQEPPSTSVPRVYAFPFFYWGALLALGGVAASVLGVLLATARWLVPTGRLGRVPDTLIVYSGVAIAIGIVLIVVDLIFGLPRKRRLSRHLEPGASGVRKITVVLTAYNDEAAIGDAVHDFRRHPLVTRVIVVSNNSRDQTMARAEAAGAIVHNETLQGYGRCVYRCLNEGIRFDDTSHVVLCEGDRTFRATDIDKFIAYMGHAELVNGTRIVEQLRDYDTQLSTWMYYGNFIVGKLLEVRHLGQGTFTDVGTTYKMASRETFAALLPHLDPRVNLEFNAHFLDTALRHGVVTVECPITFHRRVGVSKGGNASNLRAMRVGFRMLIGLSFGWRWVR